MDEKDVREKRAKAIRSRRISAGMSQVEFAAALGVEPSCVSRWERGLVSPGRAAKKALLLRFGLSLRGPQP